tara:strand:- start:653 stop:2443 length:1791 start_codon:yes stop_codon:yes gene_type:complete
MQTIKKLIFLLSPHEKKRAVLLLIMILIMALLDTIGIASILPFVAVLTNPDLIETNLLLNKMFFIANIFGIQNEEQFLLSLGILVFVLLILSLSFKTLTTYLQVQFVQMREYSIGRRLIEGYLHQPYSWFLSRNSSELGKNILSEVQQLINDGMFALIELIAKGLVVISIIILLIIADPILAFLVGLSLAGSYFLIFYFVRKYLVKIGSERMKNNQIRFKSISEAFGAAKEVKFKGLEKYYIEKFSDSAKMYAKSQALSKAIAQLPRFILEAVAFGGILLIIIYFLARTGNFNAALPILSLYVFAGYRLMPSLQQIYASFSNITFIGPSLDKIYSDLKNLKVQKYTEDQEILTLKKEIKLINVKYNYPNAQQTTLENINLNIPFKSSIGIVGATGCGKTTTIDIILGLIEPSSGTFEVDGKVITNENSRSWQKSIGYVPQNIYLSDDSVESNIAFGLDSKYINKDTVEKASKIANLHNFVIEELPNQYKTIIGERGIRLSGGQRQRIGIARALYHNPQVLILDEATSALDNQTEIAVMDALDNLSENITVIMIAHRLTTVKKCDKIFLLEDGKIKNKGTFEELVNTDENFRVNTYN